MTKTNYPKYKILINPDSKKVQGLKMGDVVRRQYYDAPDLIYSLMVVLETGVEMVGDADSAYFIGALVEGDAPETGQPLDFVRVTNLFDRERGGALYLTASDSDAPYMDVIDGLATEYSLLSTEDILRSEGEFRFSLDGAISHPEKLLISYKIRASKPLENVPLTLGYEDKTDGSDSILISTEWEYKLSVITIDYPAQYARELSISPSLAMGDWCEIQNLNVVRLSDISNFSKAAKVRIGRITGVVDPLFGVLHGYGAYFRNLYATRNVNIAGTLTAGDENGFASTFYVGKIHKNVIPNSLYPVFTGIQPAAITEKSPAGMGGVWKTGQSVAIKVQSADWRKSHTDQTYCFSIWVKSQEAVTLTLKQDGYHIGDNHLGDDGAWKRIHASFTVRDAAAGAMVIGIDSTAAVLVSSPQMESGESPSLYQPTDGTLSMVEDYGAWFSKGGIGGTIQNPLLKLNEDGSISSRDGSFVINPDGTGHFASGRFSWNKDTITLQDFTIRWEDLSEDARENLKGETGATGNDGIDGTNGKDGKDGKDGVDGGTGPQGLPGKDGTDGRDGIDANLLDWVQEWNSGKTVITSEILITPKIFAGIKNVSGTITGVALGHFTLLSRNSSGQFQMESINGIYGFRDGYRTFSIDTTGSVAVGRGDQSIRYNAQTGMIEFGAAVSMQWVGATYVDANGIFTGTLSANVINAIAINASQITAGKISASLIDTVSLKSELITAANIEALTLNVVKGKIGGWSIDADSIYRGTKNNTANGYTTANGSITIGSNGIRGYKWRLDSTGAGALAGGNISWDAAGNVTFAQSVTVQWTALVSSVQQQIDNTVTPRLTQISATGIYTGTLTAAQVNAVAINASSITTGTLAAARIAAGSITVDKLDVTTLKANLITAANINGLTLTFDKGTIGGWKINSSSITSSSGNLILDNANKRIAVFGSGASSTSGLRVMLHYTSTSNYGLQVLDASNAILVNLGYTNSIAGWNITQTYIYKNSVYLGADGSIYNGTRWKLNNDGSGQIANGNISWNASGTVTFSSAVSLNWTTGINSLTTALGGSTYPKLTNISSTGIYTGTLTATQVNAVAINAASITTGTLSAARIAAGSITVDKLDVTALKANLITAANINGLTLTFDKGTIGGWKISSSSITSSSGNVVLDNLNKRIAVYGSGASSTSGSRVMMHYTSTSNYGLQVLDSSNAILVNLGYTNSIAGWNITQTYMYKNSVYLGADGSLYNGTKWKLNNDGSGQIANGNISWNTSGVVTFASSVSLNWTSGIDAITTALGGSTYPKLTKITSAGIYTGTISASQITVDSVLIVGGSTYNGSVSVRDASNSVKVTLDRTGITAVGGKIGGWNITSSSIYAGSVYLSNDGTIYNGNYWRLNNNGSGLLASNNIFWDAAGAITLKNATIQDVTIKGSIRTPFVRVDGSISIVIGGSAPVVSRPDSEKYDNMCIIGGSDSGGWNLAEPKLPWNVEQSGRRLCLTHYRYNSEIVSGTCTFTAPSGYYFYEYGRQSTTLKMSRETIELMGYGTSTQFYGWIVLNRRDLLTTGRYGAYQQFLAMGTVTCTSTSAATLKYRTYDGSTMSVSKTGGGSFTVYLPWSLGADKYMVIMTGAISAVQNTPIYATIKAQYSSYFYVQTQDDASANDGSFNFIVVSTADFK